MEKICKACGVSKPITAYRARAATCSACYNTQRKAAKQKDADIASLKTVKMVEHLNEATKLAEEHDDEVTMTAVYELLEEAMREVDNIRNEELVLRFSKPLSPAVEIALKKCVELNISHGTLIYRSKEPSLKKAFFETFGVEQESIKSEATIKEINNLFITMGGINVAYDFFADERLMYNTMIAPAEKTPRAKSEYNFVTKEICLYKNPIKITAKDFLKRLRLETQDHYGIMYHHREKLFDLFYAQYSL